MRRILNIIKSINGNDSPLITHYDILTGIIIMFVMVAIALGVMALTEPNTKEIKDANVQEESIQHLHPHIP